MAVPDWNKPNFVIDEREIAVDEDGHTFRQIDEGNLPFDTGTTVRVTERVSGIAMYSETRSLDLPISEIIEHANYIEYEIRNRDDLESLAEDMAREMEFDDYNDDIEYDDHDANDFEIESAVTI